MRAALAVLLSLMSFALLGLFGPAAPASAHAGLVTSTPLAGEVLETPPDAIVLDFDEPVELSLGGVKVFDGTGALLPLGTAGIDPGDHSIVRLALPVLQEGSYVVSYRLVSADSHPATGAFTFQIGSVSTLAPDVVERVVSSSGTSDSANALLGVLRVLMYAGLLVAGGFLAAIAAGVVEPTLQHRRILQLAATGAGLAGLLQLPMQAGFLTGQGPSAVTDLDAWSAVVGTRSGGLWLVRAVLAYFGGLGLALTSEQHRRQWWRAGVASWLLAIAALSAAGGHGSTGRWAVLGVAVTIVHVVGVMVWIGGLVALLVRSDELTDRGVRTFSGIARIAATAVVVTGVLQAVRRIRSFDALLHTGYGRLVVAKAVTVGVVLAFAAASRAVARGAAIEDAAAGEHRQLLRSVRAELVFALVAVALTAGLMGANPEEAAPTEPFATTLVSEGYIASIAIDPAVVGPTQIHLYFSSPGGSISTPDSVTATLDQPTEGVAPFDVSLVPVGANHYQSLGASVPVAGDWTLTVTAVYDGTSIEFTAAVPID